MSQREYREHSGHRGSLGDQRAKCSAFEWCQLKGDWCYQCKKGGERAAKQMKSYDRKSRWNRRSLLQWDQDK